MIKAKTVNEYILKAPPKAGPMLRKMRSIIKKAAPKATEKIAWGMPFYYHQGMLVSFGVFKDHVSFFAATGHLLKKFKKELSKYKTSKGTIQFPFGEKLPEKFITKMVKMRVKEKEKPPRTK